MLGTYELLPTGRGEKVQFVKTKFGRVKRRKGGTERERDPALNLKDMFITFLPGKMG